MSHSDIEQLYSNKVLGNYGMPPVTLVKGRGARVWDDEGEAYLDFCSGIAVLTLGHCHPRLVRRVQAQAAELMHVSNLYRNENQALLAQKLDALAGGGGRVFFCNSGAEANEALIKLSRLYGVAKSGGESSCYKVIVAEKAFHGRTFGGMSATPQAKIQDGFSPLVPGFESAPLNDLDGFASKLDQTTAAVFVETVQGEGGVNPCSVEFLKGLRQLCNEKSILLMLDEVQCGVGRSGTFFAFEKAGIQPDAIGMAKGLAGGLPIGAVWMRDAHASLFKPGTHGTTFGGTPLVCAAALEVLAVIEEEGLLEQVCKMGAYLKAALESLACEYPEYIAEVRGEGFMLGVALSESPLEMVALLRSKGLIVPPAGGNVVRFLPPLNASKDEIDEALGIFQEAVAARAELAV